MILWITQIFTQLEVTVVDFTIAVVFANAAIQHQGTGESAIAIVFALQFIPALPASVIAGTIADIFDKRKLILGLNIFRVVFLLLFIFKSDAGAQLYFFVLVMAISLHMYDVIEKSTLRNVVSEEELPTANGLFITTSNASTLIGVVASGYLEKAIGFQGVLLSGSILFGIASILSYKLPRNMNSMAISNDGNDIRIEREKFSKSLKTTFKTIKESLHFLVTTPAIWLAMIIVIIVQGVTLSIASISFQYGNDVLHIGSEKVAFFLLIPVALGLAIGGIVSPLLTKRFQYKGVILTSGYISGFLITFFGIIAYITSSILPAVSLEFIVFEVLVILMGIFATLAQAPSLEIIQKFSESNIRGKVFGILVGASNSVAGIFVGLSAILVELVHSRTFAIILGSFIVIFFYGYSILLKKALKGRDFSIQTNPEDPIHVGLQPTVL